MSPTTTPRGRTGSPSSRTGPLPATNPCGTTFWTPRISGISPDGTAASGRTGILITDTSDVHLAEPFLADFDRAGASGTGVRLASAAAGGGVGLTATAPG